MYSVIVQTIWKVAVLNLHTWHPLISKSNWHVFEKQILITKCYMWWCYLFQNVQHEIDITDELEREIYVTLLYLDQHHDFSYIDPYTLFLNSHLPIVFFFKSPGLFRPRKTMFTMTNALYSASFCPEMSWYTMSFDKVLKGLSDHKFGVRSLSDIYLILGYP